MNRTSTRLIRLAGLAALLAGMCYIVLGIFHPVNAPSTVTTTSWASVHVLACAMSFFGVLGIVGLYARQAPKTGWLGFAGFVMLSLWFTLIMGFSFVEAFVLPHVVTATPSFVEGWMGMLNGTTSSTELGVLPTLWTLTGALYILGGVLFGIATFRAGILPRAAAILLIVGTALAPAAAFLPLEVQPKIAIPTGIAVAWLGYALLIKRETQSHNSATEPAKN